MTDASQYLDNDLKRPIPTLILHGVKDDIVPIENSQNYASKRPWVKLIELNSDHSLTNVLPMIWQEIQTFCFL